MYAVHSIKYTNLSSYFYIFSIWIDNICLSWDETIEYAEILGLEIVQVIYDGIYDENKIKISVELYSSGKMRYFHKNIKMNKNENN